MWRYRLLRNLAIDFMCGIQRQICPDNVAGSQTMLACIHLSLTPAASAHYSFEHWRTRYHVESLLACV